MAKAKPERLIESTVSIRESIGGDGKKWAVTILDEGLSKNQRWYSRASVTNHVPLFEGAWVNIDHYRDAEQQARPEGSITRRGGVIRNVHVVEGDNGKVRMDAELHVILPWVGEAMMRAQEAGAPGWAGLSIDAFGVVNPQHNAELGRSIPTVEGFTKVNSVDLVTIPATGGAIRHVLESQEIDNMNPEELVLALREAVKEDMATMVPAMVRSELATALQEAAGEDEADAEDEDENGEPYDAEDVGEGDEDEDEDEDGDEDDEDDEVQESVRVAMSEVNRLREAVASTQAKLDAQAFAATINGKLAASGMPNSLQGLARQRIASEVRGGRVTEARVDAILKETRDTWAEMAQQNPSSQPGMPTPVGITGKGAQYMDRLLATFGDTTVKADPFLSLREAYCHFTGADAHRLHPIEIFRAMMGTGYDSAFSSSRVREALTTASWGDIFADVMYNRLGKIYNNLPYDEWRQLCSTIENAPDFMTQNSTIYGGYGNIPVVAENDPYLPLGSPGDQKTSWAIAKRGGTEVITLEMVVNNKLGVVSKIPDMLAYATKRTLYEFAMGMITTSAPTMSYDMTALYDASHGNVDNEELTVQGLDAVEQAHMAQVPFGQPSNEVLGSRGQVKLIIISRAQRLRANTLLKPSDRVRYDGMTQDSTQIDPGAFVGSGITPVVYDRLVGTDWYSAIDPKAPGVNGLSIGFLGGRQEPELFVQDNPTIGEAMSHDRINFKVRHIYGGTIPDHRVYAKHTP